MFYRKFTFTCDDQPTKRIIIPVLYREYKTCICIVIYMDLKKPIQM